MEAGLGAVPCGAAAWCVLLPGRTAAAAIHVIGAKPTTSWPLAERCAAQQ